MFAKVFEQIYDSSIAEDYNCRRMFMDLLVLADPTGAVDMTLEAISRRTNVPFDEVSKYVAMLCQPDIRSRSQLEQGKRLIPLDKNRDWGWKIVNYQHYRKLKDEEARRSYFRDAQRKSRANKKKKEEVEEEEGVNSRLTSSNGVKPLSKTQTVEDWLKELEADKTYSGIDVHREYGKMLNWCKIRRKQPTKRRFINWLNQAEKSLPTQHASRADYKRNYLPPAKELSYDELEKQRKIVRECSEKLKKELSR
jgi:hypothetical protein